MNIYTDLSLNTYPLDTSYKLSEEKPTPFSALEVTKTEVEEDLNFLKHLDTSNQISSAEKVDEEAILFFKSSNNDKIKKHLRKRKANERDSQAEGQTEGQKTETSIKVIHKKPAKLLKKGLGFSTRKEKVHNEVNSTSLSLTSTSLPVTNSRLFPEPKKIFSLKPQTSIDYPDYIGPTLPSFTFPSSLPPSLPTSFTGDSLAKLRFSQKTVNCHLGDGTYLFENLLQDQGTTLFDILRTQGWSTRAKDKIDVVLMPDGDYTSFDNRRLTVAKAINELFSHSIEVFANTHHHLSDAPLYFLNRVSRLDLSQPIKEIKANTFGHAITTRILNSNPSSDSDYYGFSNYPLVVTGLQGHGKKKIVIDSTRNQVFLR